MLGVLLLAAGLSCGVRSAKTGEQPSIAPEVLLRELVSYNGAVTALKGKALVVYKEGEKVASLKATIAVDKTKTRYKLEIYDYVFNKHLVTVLRKNPTTFHTSRFKSRRSPESRFQKRSFSRA
jgi:hypothetical protein